MDNKEKFKEFIKDKTYLIDYIKSGEMTWQKFYELYDLYGDNKDIWNKYNDRSINIGNIVKNIDVNQIQKHIETAQKALSIVEELTLNKNNNTNNVYKTISNPRPINKFFED